MKQIFYQLPNQVSIELVSEMHLQCYDFGPFDTPIEELLEDYSQASGGATMQNCPVNSPTV